MSESIYTRNKPNSLYDRESQTFGNVAKSGIVWAYFPTSSYLIPQKGQEQGHGHGLSNKNKMGCGGQSLQKQRSLFMLPIIKILKSS